MPQTTRETAETLHLSIRTIQRYITHGVFPHAYKERGRFLIPDNDIEAYTRQRATTERQRATTERQNDTPERQNDTPGSEGGDRDTPEQDNLTQTTHDTADIEREDNNDTPGTEDTETQIFDRALPVELRVKHHLFINVGFLKYEYFRYSGDKSIIHDAFSAVIRKFAALFSKIRNRRGRPEE